MTELMQIQSFIQAYVKAVSSILETEVTIIDNELMRVGGTGEHMNKLGQKISHDSFFQKIIETQKPGIIRNVREELMCNTCEKKSQCKELANLGYPIFLENKVIGVIGIIAFNEKTRERLLNNHKKLEEFLKYMSELIESKIVTHRISINFEHQLREVINTEKNATKTRPFLSEDSKTIEMLNMVKKVSHSNSTILLTGESGTGKEVIAKLIHSESDRNDRLMISLNCGAIPEHLVESELFGYEEGSFTGAKKGGHIGKFELANKSTLFLDEIGEMPLQIQTKLLRVLQEQVVERVGGKTPIPIDVRVICATNKDLLTMVAENKFRGDLYYRLNVIPIKISPLRERRGDISILIHHFILEYNVKLNKKILGITSDAEEILVAYDWPGNVRELKNIIEYLTNVVDSDVIKVSDLPNNLLASTSTNIRERSLAHIIGDYERIVLENLIKKANTLEKKDNLAAQLGISRATLYRKLSNYDLL